MPKIAISYRRSDSSAIAGRMFDRLVARYGEGSVFMDIDNIPFGTDFRTHIQETLRQIDILIAVIGPNWIAVNATGAARMQEQTDPVRVEIETALGRKTPIIPVLVDGAKMPDSTELPPEFGNFAFLNAAEVATGRDFRIHMDRLIRAIDRNIAGTGHIAPLSGRTQTVTAPSEHAANKSLLTDVMRYMVLPLILLLVAHHVIVNALDVNIHYLQNASAFIPFVFGFALYLMGGRGTATACAFAIALGIIGAAGMTISQSLSSGDPIMPQTRFEWWDNVNFAIIIALSFTAGHVLARMLRALLWRQSAKQ
jgi:hypothetical protein